MRHFYSVAMEAAMSIQYLSEGGSRLRATNEVFTIKKASTSTVGGETVAPL